MGFEFQILDYLQTVHTPILDVIMLCITRLGDMGVFWILLALILLARKQTRRLGLIMAAALIMDLLVCHAGVKEFFARVRPYDIKQPLYMILERQKDYSFPSGHTSVSFAATTALFYGVKERRSIWKWACLLSLLIGFSRLYFYVHFPTDVLGGIAVGIFEGWLAYRLILLLEGWSARRKSKKQ